MQTLANDLKAERIEPWLSEVGIEFAGSASLSSVGDCGT